MNFKIIPLGFLLLVLFALSSCKEDTVETAVKGDIIITAVDLTGLPLVGVEITSEPSTTALITNENGQAELNDLPQNIYKINALKPNSNAEETLYGSVPVHIKSDTLVIVDLVMLTAPPPPYDPFITPASFTLESPAQDATFPLGESVGFFARSSGGASIPVLNASWESDVDGLLFQEIIGAVGYTHFHTNTLSVGAHEITLTVTDTEDNVSTIVRNINIVPVSAPSPVTLQALTSTQSGFNLNWSEYEEEDFAQYKIYRKTFLDEFELIDSISDQTITSYQDKDLPFNVLYQYQIGLEDVNGYEANSNTEYAIHEGIFIDLNIGIDIEVQLYSMIVDPERPYIYAIDRNNNKLFFINEDSMAVTKVMNLTEEPTDLDINLENTKLYIAQFGSNQIRIYDLETQAYDGNLIVEESPFRIACLADNKIAFNGANEYNSIQMVDVASGEVFGETESIHDPGLLSTADQTQLFVTETNSPNASIFTFNIVDDAFLPIETSSGVSNYETRDAVLSGDENHLFFGSRKFNSSGFGSGIGLFDEPIYACNFDGSIAIGEEFIWDATSFSVIKPMPLNSNIMVMDKDYSNLYIYSNETNKIYLIDVSEY